MSQKSVSPAIVAHRMASKQCDKCKKCESLDNLGLGGETDRRAMKARKFECRECKLEARVAALETMQHKQIEIDSAIKELKGRITALESKCSKFVDGELNERAKEATRLETVKVSTGKVARKLDLVASKAVVHKLDYENKVEEFSKEIKELNGRMTAMAGKIEEHEKGWPTPQEAEEWEMAVGKKARRARRNQLKGVSFGEKYKGKAKDTVVVVGDSLVRGVGRKLEGNSHMFTAISKGGARIEQVEEVISKMDNNKDRHLVVIVGTNNIKQEGSEVVVKKYKKLIDVCKGKENRAVTIVGIPRRYDVNSLQESRRFGVNSRLEKMCKSQEIEFFGYEPVRSKVDRYGLHLNDEGQDDLAGMIFRHCKDFLE